MQGQSSVGGAFSPARWIRLPFPVWLAYRAWFIAALARRHFVVISIGGFHPAGRLRLIAIVVGSCPAWAATGDPPAAIISAPCAAERICGAAPARPLQFRTLVAGAGRQSSASSGFLVAPDGPAVANDQLVSQVALEPKTYRLEYTTENAGTPIARCEVRL